MRLAWQAHVVLPSVTWPCSCPSRLLVPRCALSWPTSIPHPGLSRPTAGSRAGSTEAACVSGAAALGPTARVGELVLARYPCTQPVKRKHAPWVGEQGRPWEPDDAREKTEREVQPAPPFRPPHLAAFRRATSSGGHPAVPGLLLPRQLPPARALRPLVIKALRQVQPHPEPRGPSHLLTPALGHVPTPRRGPHHSSSCPCGMLE